MRVAHVFRCHYILIRGDEHGAKDVFGRWRAACWDFKFKLKLGRSLVFHARPLHGRGLFHTYLASDSLKLGTRVQRVKWRVGCNWHVHRRFLGVDADVFV